MAISYANMAISYVTMAISYANMAISYVTIVIPFVTILLCAIFDSNNCTLHVQEAYRYDIVSVRYAAAMLCVLVIINN